MEAGPRPVDGPKTSPSCFRIAASPRPRGFACGHSLRIWTGYSNTRRCLAFSVTPLLVTPLRRNGTINPLSFVYASRPPLRDRLTLGGLTFPRNPWAFGAQVFHLRFRYSCRHSRFRFVQLSSRSAFTLARNAPLPVRRSPAGIRSFGGVLEPR